MHYLSAEEKEKKKERKKRKERNGNLIIQLQLSKSIQRETRSRETGRVKSIVCSRKSQQRHNDAGGEKKEKEHRHTSYANVSKAGIWTRSSSLRGSPCRCHFRFSGAFSIRVLIDPPSSLIFHVTPYRIFITTMTSMQGLLPISKIDSSYEFKFPARPEGSPPIQSRWTSGQDRRNTDRNFF